MQQRPWQALFEDEQVDTIECESAEAALGTLLMGGREVAMIFADVRLRGVMDGIDLAREVKMRWPLLPVILASGHPRERVGVLPPGVAYLPKSWQSLNVLIAAAQALASRCDVRRQPARATVLAVFERAADRGFFFGFVLPARTAIDVAKTSRSAASQCCSAWP
jgi:CheY-like chemotaxis protein